MRILCLLPSTYISRLFQGLLWYIIPLVLVYFAEYFINQGLVSEGRRGGMWEER